MILPCFSTGRREPGKELFAQSLHTCSHRAQKAFYLPELRGDPESLLEGIFFGVEKGSFTGAENRKGLFELADGGTLFLDEINSMDISMQAKLLKAIEEQQVRRIGSAKSTHFHTRIICAMNKSPAEVLRAGLMRTDLFYRICVVRIDIPPLRDRKPDVMILTDYFINHFNRTMGKSIQGVSALVKMTFQNYNWKGNVRELKNTLEYAFNLCQGNIINMGDLPDILQEDLEPQIFPQENSGCFPGPSLPQLQRQTEGSGKGKTTWKKPGPERGTPDVWPHVQKSSPKTGKRGLERGNAFPVISMMNICPSPKTRPPTKKKPSAGPSKELTASRKPPGCSGFPGRRFPIKSKNTA